MCACACVCVWVSVGVCVCVCVGVNEGLGVCPDVETKADGLTRKRNELAMLYCTECTWLYATDSAQCLKLLVNGNQVDNFCRGMKSYYLYTIAKN